MSMNTDIFNSITRHLREIGFNMNILLVEDDEILQKQFQKLLFRFFGRVDVASNGVQALEKYSQRQYNLILTDITMPLMDGIELSTKIRALDSSQHILVISAHSDSEKLIELINIGIDGFMLKPINMENVLKLLDKVCQSIYDQNMLKYYSKMLEETNEELRVTNSELDRVLSELTRLKSHENTLSTENIFSVKDYHQISAQEFFISYSFLLATANEDFEDLEDRINLTLLKTENTPMEHIFEELIAILQEYYNIIKNTPQFEFLAEEMDDLVKTLKEFGHPEKLESLLPKLTLLFDSFEQWRKSLFSYKNAEDIHFMDHILINEIKNIQKTL